MDREKVISGLQCCRLINKVNCDKCPYDYNGRGNGKSECTAELAEDALALLKEQKKVEPCQHDAVWLCGNCEKEVVGWDDDIDGKEYRYPFCRQCGRSVKWE